jgi:site-specific recombinase XerD
MTDILKQLLQKDELSLLKKMVKEGGTPLWQYWEEFVDHYLREGKSEVTVRNVRDTLRSVVRNLNILTIEDCNTPEILREALFKIKEERNWSNVTFNNCRKNLNTYFLWLECMEYIDENKIKKIRKCKEEQNEQYTLNEDQVRSILGQVRQRRQTRLERWRNDFFIGLLVVTGARPCELLQLQCRDVQKMKDGSYKVVIRGRKQKGRNRYYRMPSWIRDSYEMYVTIRQDLEREEANLFVSSSKRTGWTDKGMRGLFKRLSKELGFRVNAYAIRRFVATKLNAEGVDVKDIMNHLGHTRLSTTHRYIERSCCLTDKGVDEIEKFMS